LNSETTVIQLVQFSKSALEQQIEAELLKKKTHKILNNLNYNSVNNTYYGVIFTCRDDFY